MTRWLVVRADGFVRVVTRRPRELRLDECALQINIEVPEGWGDVIGTIDVTMPDPPAVDADGSAMLRVVEES